MADTTHWRSSSLAQTELIQAENTISPLFPLPLCTIYYLLPLLNTENDIHNFSGIYLSNSKRDDRLMQR